VGLLGRHCGKYANNPAVRCTKLVPVWHGRTGGGPAVVQCGTRVIALWYTPGLGGFVCLAYYSSECVLFFARAVAPVTGTPPPAMNYFRAFTVLLS
jgi:hypothetical protein